MQFKRRQVNYMTLHLNDMEVLHISVQLDASLLVIPQVTRPLDASLAIYEAGFATMLLVFLQDEADYACILPHLLQYEADSSANLPLILLYEADHASILLQILKYDDDSAAILLCETDFAGFLLLIPLYSPAIRSLFCYATDSAADLAAYTASDASNWTHHYW